MPEMHDFLEDWTLDEAAESLNGISLETSGVLWSLIDPDGNNTPMGGDGTDGTVETPDGRQGDFDDKLKNNWHRLTVEQQNEINEAAQICLEEEEEE